MVLQIELSPKKSASSVTMGESSVEAFHQGSTLHESESFLHMIRQNELQDADSGDWLTGHGSNFVEDSQPSFPIDQHLDTAEEFVIQDHEHDFPCMPSDLDADSCGGETEETVECQDAEEIEVQAGQSNVGDDSLDHNDLGDDSLAKVDIEACVNSALQSLPHAVPKPIWEQGIWASIFGSGMLMELKQFEPEFHRPAYVANLDNWFGAAMDVRTSVKRPRECDHLDSFGDVVKHVTDVAWEEERESVLQMALKRWLVTITAFKATCQVSLHVGDAVDDAARIIVLGDYFRGKAPSTLLKRVRAVEKICNFVGIGNFPCDEVTMYRFFTAERMSGAPPSRLKGYLEAAAFCFHVFGMDELKQVVGSKRLHGATYSDLPKEINQSCPLRVDELLKLHQLLDDETSWNSLFAGAVLFAVYARSRWADLQHSCKLTVDADFQKVTMYIEAATAVHKTMHADMFRHRFLPLVAPSWGVAQRPWVDRWLEVRRRMGVKMPPMHVVMPAPSSDGSPCVRPLSATEAGGWLRKILLGSPEQSSERRLTAHSMKSTTLSFAAKYGLSAETRLQLGYHVAGFKILHTYSRDAAAQPLMELEKVLLEIRQERFKPDETRSGRFVTTGKDLALETIALPVHDSAAAVPVVDLEAKTEEVQGSELVDSSSSSDSSEEEFQEVQARRVFPPPTPPEGYIFWQHRKLRTLHITKPDFSKVFVCSRAIGANYTKDGMNIRYDTPVCRGCMTAVRVMEKKIHTDRVRSCV